MTTDEGTRPVFTTSALPVPEDDGGPAYWVMRENPRQDGQPVTSHLVECWPRDPQGYGAITAVTRAAHLSLDGEPVFVLLPDGTLLARFIGGAREGRTRPLRAPVKAVD